MSTRTVPFDGDPPSVKDGDAIEIRDGSGNWHPSIAKSAPRYDLANAIGKCWLTVSVVLASGDICNWPAEDVRLQTYGGTEQ